MKTRKGDFVELEFVGKTSAGEIFDTNMKEEAKKIGVKDVKPLIVCVGEGMVIRGLDKALEGKETGKEYIVEIKPEDAFGKRRSELVKIFPLSAFRERGIMPRQGETLVLDDLLARVVSVSAGRVILDFNHPLAGKTLTYKFKIKRKISDVEEKTRALLSYFLGVSKFRIDGKKVVIDSSIKILPATKKKIEGILNMKLETRSMEKK